MLSSTIHISRQDHEALRLLLQSLERQPVATDKLRAELARAIICDPGTLPAGTIGLNSRIELQDLDTGEKEHYILSLPAAADPARQRLSILAPVGTALIGYHVGDEIAWPTPGGVRRLRVLSVGAAPVETGSAVAMIVAASRRVASGLGDGD